MGVFYYFHAVALAEDLPEFEIESNSTEEYMKEFYSKVDSGYTQVISFIYYVSLFKPCIIDANTFCFCIFFKKMGVTCI